MQKAYIEVDVDLMQPILDSLWQLAITRTGIIDVDPKYINKGLFDLKIKTEVNTSYIYKKKEYTASEFIDLLGTEALMPKSRKFQRKLTLKAMLGISNPITESFVEEMGMELDFFINHTKNSECFIGNMLYSWDECSSHINVYHRDTADINSVGFKRCQSLICQVGKDLTDNNSLKLKELTDILNKVPA